MLHGNLNDMSRWSVSVHPGVGVGCLPRAPNRLGPPLSPPSCPQLCCCCWTIRISLRHKHWIHVLLLRCEVWRALWPCTDLDTSREKSDWKWTKPKKKKRAWTLVAWSHQRRSFKTSFIGLVQLRCWIFKADWNHFFNACRHLKYIYVMMRVHKYF